MKVKRLKEIINKCDDNTDIMMLSDINNYSFSMTDLNIIEFQNKDEKNFILFITNKQYEILRSNDKKLSELDKEYFYEK